MNTTNGKGWMNTLALTIAFSILLLCVSVPVLGAVKAARQAFATRNAERTNLCPEVFR